MTHSGSATVNSGTPDRRCCYCCCSFTHNNHHNVPRLGANGHRDSEVEYNAIAQCQKRQDDLMAAGGWASAKLWTGEKEKNCVREARGKWQLDQPLTNSSQFPQRCPSAQCNAA